MPRKSRVQTRTVPVSTVRVGDSLTDSESPVTKSSECYGQATHIHLDFAKGWSWCIHRESFVSVSDE